MNALFLRAHAYFFKRLEDKSQPLKRPSLRSLQGYFFSLVLGLSLASFAVEPFLAYVDKTEIKAGQTFRLTLEYNDQTSEQPDFSPLEIDFTIVSQKTSTQASYVNGAYQGKTRFILEIEPKSETPELTIPSIKLGTHMTSPIRVRQSTKPDASSGESKEIALSVTVDRPEVYVKGQLTLNVEIKTPLSLQNGTINKPEIADAIMETLAEDHLQESVENGIKYFVFTRSYAIFPGKAGTLVIPPLTFKGVVADVRMKSDPLSGFFSSGKRISARSSPIHVTVKDVPKSFPKDQPFLPLKSLLVIESFDVDPKFAVNKATTRRFEIKAKGTLASNLPTIAVPTVEKVQIYAENGNKIQKNVDDNLESSLKVSHVYMPTAPGEVKVPEQVIYWWDVDTDELRTATIRALDLAIEGTAPQTFPESDKKTEENISAPATSNNDLLEKSSSKGPDFVWGFWQVLALFFLVLWLITIALFLWRRQKSKTVAEAPDGYEKTLQNHIQNIVVACDALDAKAAYQALQTMREWTKRQEQIAWFDQAVGEKQRELEAVLFEKDQLGDKKKVLADLKHRLRDVKCGAAPQKAQLLPLYPQ